MRSFPSGGIAALLAALALPLAAQDPVPLPQIITSMTEIHRATDLDIPQPPRAAVHEAPMGRLPMVPVADSGLPQPDSAPVVIGDLEHQNPQAGVFTFFRNRDHRPSGGAQLHPGEPAACASRDTYLATGNTYGSLSKDSGVTWTHVNPFTLFPAVDGGVCCDQRVLAAPTSDLVLWYIQYRFSATTTTGGFRLAWSVGRDGLRNSSWNSTYFSAAQFGYSNAFMDFPDIAATAGFVYITSNVFTGAGSYIDSVVGRIALADLTNGGGVSLAFYRRLGSGNMGGGASYRFTQTYNGNPGTIMFWGSHNSTSSIRLFRWDDGNTARSSDVDRSIPAWTSGTGSSVGPDGRDWIGFDDHRIATGYLNHVFPEATLIWSSNANGGSRPQSYVRVQVFRPSDRAIIAQEDVFHGALDFGYPAVGMNSLGHGGMVMSGGGSTTHVTTFFMIVDNYFGLFAGNTIFPILNGSNGAPSNRWGDYHSVVANPIDNRTFIGTGMTMSGGTGTSSTMHRTAWFGRDDYTPVWVDLSVSSVPNGASITVDETDRNGSKNGVTPFTRSYTPQQGYTLTAPASFASGGNTFLFNNWTGTGGSTSSTAFTVSSIGFSADTASANYSLQSIITVDDRNVAGSVPITVGTADLDGQQNGSTRFTRRYKVNATGFTFTAPALAGNQPFRRWYLNGTAQATGQPALTVIPSTGTLTIEAEYCNYVAGSYATYGSGCLGSNGLTPLHGSTSTPDLGASVTHTISRLRGATPAVMFLGFSKTTWNGTPLPLCLGFIGANPSCCILTEVFLQLPIGVDVAGNGSITFSVSSDPAALGVHTFTQVVAADIFVPDPLKIVVSNGLDMTVGGSTIGGQRCP
jgi:hypothetical protein